MRRYGVPYKGSKNAIAEWVVEHLPEGRHFYDLFAGGCAVTDCAMRMGKYETYTVNDTDSGPRLFMDAIQGKYRDEKRWISRDDFYKLKDTDPYVKWCWSFGSNGRDYLYAKAIEPWKKALHYSRVLNDDSLLRGMGLACGGSRKEILKYRDECKSAYVHWAARGRHFAEIESLERTNSLKRLESAERLQSLERLQSDYQDVPIAPDSVIYCDIPYKGKNRYNEEFDHNRFYDWCGRQTAPIVISEYEMPEDRFVCIAEKERRGTYCSTNNNHCVTEKLFIPMHQKQ